MTDHEQPAAGVALKPGDLHTLMMDVIREDIQRQHPEAFTEDNDFDLIIQSGPERPSYVKIDTSALAEAILLKVQSRTPARFGGEVTREAVARIIREGLSGFNGRARPSFANPAQQMAAFADTITDRIFALIQAPTDAGGAVSEAIDWLNGQRRTQASAAVRNGDTVVNHTEIVGFIDLALAALTPAPQAEGEGLPGHADQCCCPGCLAAHDKSQPLQQGGEVTRDAVERLERLANDAAQVEFDDNGYLNAADTDAIRTILALFASLAADRDKAVGLLCRWRSDLPSEALEDLTDAFLSSQTGGR